jgi:hypothetical protein
LISRFTSLSAVVSTSSVVYTFFRYFFSSNYHILFN